MLPKLNEIALTLAARVVAMIGPFGVSVITARALGPEGRGRYFLVLSFAQIAAQIANLGLSSSNTYLAAQKPELLGPLTVNSLYAAFVVAPLCALATVVVMDRPDLLGFPPPAGGSIGELAFMAVLLAPTIVAFLFLSNLAVAVGRVRLFNGITIGYGAAALLMAAVIGWEGGGLFSFLAGALLASGALTVIAAAFLLSENRRFRFDIGLFRQGISYSTRAYLAVMLGFLMSRIGVIALQQKADFAAVGQFSIAVQFSDALILLPATIGLLLFPSLIRTEPHLRWGAQWKAFWTLGGTMLAILAAGALVLPWLIPLIFGARYADAVPLVLAMFPSVLLMSLTTVLSQYLASEGFPWGQVMAWLAGVVVQTVLAFWLAAPYGAMGVIYALTTSSLLVFAMVLVEAFRMRLRTMN